MVRSKIRDLQGVLAHSFGKDFEVLEYKTRFLTAPGEHYGSIMLALDVVIKRSKGKEELLHLVAKLIPVNEMLRIVFNIEVTFKKEVFAYLESIPTLIQFQKDYKVPENRIMDMFPKCYGARITLDKNKDEVDDDAVIIFENLKMQGYATDDRMAGLQADAVRIVLRDLAQFHALPLALRKLKPEVFEKKVRPSLVKNTGLEQLPEEVGASFHNTVMDKAQTIPELKPYLERVQKVLDHAKATAFDEKAPPNDLFGTMCHMDYWTSNTMMLRDENGKPLKCKMVDLQLMQYNSPIRDLVFFLFTSVVNAVLEQHYEEFLKCYYDSFVENLADFGIDLNQYSWEVFLKELNDVAPTEVYHLLVMLKPIFTDKEKVQNSLEDFQDSDWNQPDLLGPTYNTKLKDTIIALANRNWL